MKKVVQKQERPKAMVQASLRRGWARKRRRLASVLKPSAAGGGGGSFVYTPHQPLRLAVPGRAPVPFFVVLLLVINPPFLKRPRVAPLAVAALCTPILTYRSVLLLVA